MKTVRGRAALGLTSLCLAGAALVGANAPAAITVGPGKGNPETNPTGKCPPGQNQETSTGGMKKCA
jgi:hypothetical protein